MLLDKRLQEVAQQMVELQQELRENWGAIGFFWAKGAVFKQSVYE